MDLPQQRLSPRRRTSRCPGSPRPSPCPTHEVRRRALAVTTPTKADKQTLKLVEALDEIGVSRAAFYRMRARGQAPRHLKLPNGQIRIRRADLDAWFDACEVQEAC
ncbi:helix-turn-helix domain-containing protein [Streptomyces sp. S1A1-8]|nr:helix-turn-helix domain-containing protein [Streptomyces sp. S1A1-8]QDO31247.1 helix-turn-helix domain-containing protein [Streptomyces sp. S1A1-3]